MKDLSNVPYHKMSEQIVDILCQRTQNTAPEFFRLLTAFHLSKCGSMMHVKVHSPILGIIPVNMYAINLAPSGMGKGYGTNIMEDEVIDTFRTVFTEETFPVITEENLSQLAVKRAGVKGEDPDAELVLVQKEFEELGEMLFAFDSGTPAAVKQAHHKILMGRIGSMNFEMDEIGSNLTGNADTLSTMLELFDVGKVKKKLTKNGRDNKRNADLEGRAPTNLLMFGTPSKLFDGGRTEEEFWSLQQTGYARRCFVSYTRKTNKKLYATADEVWDALTDTSKNQLLKGISAHLGQLANPVNYNKVITMDKATCLLLIEYKQHCEKLAQKFGETDFEEMAKAEMSHRYFKVLKLAGMYSFLDGLSEITEENLYAAMRLAEDSGKAFQRLIRQDKSHVRLAKYIAASGTELTQADLTEKLPFYRGSISNKNDLLNLATAWGYKNRVIIKKTYQSGIEFISGEMLQDTDLNAVPLSVSHEITQNYGSMRVAFSKLHNLGQKDDLHWTVHQFKDGYRSDENVIPGFSLVVLDVDSGTTIDEVRVLMKDYKCLIYTTKRHTPTAHRFRLIIPTNYFLKLDSDDYKEFMQNVYSWLPFQVDLNTCDRPRKWLTNNGQYEYINGDKLIDVMEFIPKTTRNDERKKSILDLQSLTNLERWFVQNTGTGNRSNQLIKYALMLVDTGKDFAEIRDTVLELNKKLPDKLTVNEIDNTIMVSVTKALSAKNNP